MNATNATNSTRNLASSDITASWMPKDRFIREKFSKERSAATAFAKEYFERFPKDQYQTEIESWRHVGEHRVHREAAAREPIG